MRTDSQHGAAAPRDTLTPEPHELANELTDDSSVAAASSMPQTHRQPADPQREVLRPVERKVAGSVTMVILAALAIGLIIASIMFRSVAMVAIAAVFIIPFLIMVSMPVWVASTTKQAQDQTVREQRGTVA